MRKRTRSSRLGTRHVTSSVAVAVILVLVGALGALTAEPDSSRYDAGEEHDGVVHDHLSQLAGEEGGHENVLRAARAAILGRQALIGSDLSDDIGPLLDQQIRNLDVAGELLTMNEQENESDLHRAVALAKRATRWQAASLDLEWADPVPLTGYRLPSAAILELTARHRVEPDPGQLEILNDLDEVDEPLRGALARFVDAFLSFETAAQIAYTEADLDQASELLSEGGLLEQLANLEPADWLDGAFNSLQPPGVLLAELGIDLALVFPTRNQLLDATLDLEEALDEVGPVSHPMSSHGHTDMCPAMAFDLNGVNSTYTVDCALILDIGGADRYRNNAGGGNVLGTQRDICTDALQPTLLVAAALVDLGNGQDQYGNLTNPRQCGVNGGGFLGAGFLVDAGGSNTFVADRNGTNGGGAAGAGFLLDAGGNDTYTAGSGGTNGGGGLGAGFLLNAGGTDKYTAGFGGTNGGGSGGTGFLFDAGGNDTYSATNNSTNGGGFVGAGFLLDAGGNDTFSATDNATNGGGFVGTGFLFNALGNDIYTAGGTGTNGGAYLGGVGVLLDGQGGDRYTAGGTGTNGGAEPVTVADAPIHSVALLLDGGGRDRYQDPAVPGGACWDCTIAPKGATGAQVDIPTPAADGGCDPLTPAPGDTITCWAWAGTDGDRLVDEEEQVRAPSSDDVDADAGCDPLTPGPGDTVTCWAWVEVEGERVIDEEHQEEIPAIPSAGADAGCDPLTPAPGDTVTCWAWVEVDGERVVDEEETARVPSPDDVDADAGCDPLTPAPGDTVTCWAWVEVDGERLIDEEHHEEVPSIPETDADAGCEPLIPVPGEEISCWAWVEVDGDRVVDEEHQDEVPPLPGDLLPSPEYASDECDDGAVLLDGYLGDTYLRLRTASDPEGNDAWICVAVDDGDRNLGGRLVLAGNGGLPQVGEMDSPEDAVSESCADQPGNQRIQSGQVLGQDYWLDLTPEPEESSAAWVCLRMRDDIGLRFRVPGIAIAAFHPDPLVARSPRPADAPWPVTDQPSAECQDPALGSPTRLANAAVGSSQIALYAWQEDSSRLHLCLRGPGAGGRLTLDTSASPGVSPLLVTATDDLTPCAFPVITRDEPPPSFGLFLHGDPREADFAEAPFSACLTLGEFQVRATALADESATIEWHGDQA